MREQMIDSVVYGKAKLLAKQQGTCPQFMMGSLENDFERDYLGAYLFADMVRKCLRRAGFRG